MSTKKKAGCNHNNFRPVMGITSFSREKRKVRRIRNMKDITMVVGQSSSPIVCP
jgi:hypothetical protein